MSASTNVRARSRRPRQSACGERQFFRAVGDAKRAVRKKLQRIAQEVGNAGKAKKIERQLLRSHAFKLVCANRARVRMAELARKAAKERGEPLRHPYGPTLAQTMQMAAETDLWQPTDEIVGCQSMEKSKGGIMRFYPPGFARRTRDEMIAVAVKNRAALHPAQYASARGIRQLESDIAQALATGEYKWAAVSDVVDCFGHIDVANLPGLLQLPPRVVECNVGFAHFNVNRTQDRKVREEEGRHWMIEPDEDEREAMTKRMRKATHSHIYTVHGRWGIPRGPSSSPIIAEIAIAACLQDLPDDVKLFTWVDDILILAKTRAAAERAYEALRASFDASPVGTLVPRRPVMRRVADGFNYVGFRFRRRQGNSTVDPSSKNVRALLAEMEHRLAELQLRGEGAESARRYLRGWFNAFKSWKLSARLHQDYCSKIDDALFLHATFYHGLSPAEMVRSEKSLRRLRWGYRRAGNRAARTSSPLPYVRTPYWTRSSLSE